MPSLVNIRPPPATGPPQADWIPPAIDWLSGTWHLTHSSLSMWKSNRNVTVNYSIIPAQKSQDLPNKIDNSTSYQSLTSSKVKTINGIDTALGTDTSIWDWRGKGWLTIIASHWEILGYGDIPGEAGRPGQWLVVFIAATKFTNAGISILSRMKEGIPEIVLKDVLESLGRIENEAVKKFVGEIVEVLRN